MDPVPGLRDGMVLRPKAQFQRLFVDGVRPVHRVREQFSGPSEGIAVVIRHHRVGDGLEGKDGHPCVLEDRQVVDGAPEVGDRPDAEIRGAAFYFLRASIFLRSAGVRSVDPYWSERSSHLVARSRSPIM